MRFLQLLSSFVAGVCLGCATTSFTATNTLEFDDRSIAHEMNSTVALADVTDEDISVYCTGVWISDRHALTARHCATVDIMGLEAIRPEIQAFSYQDVHSDGATFFEHSKPTIFNVKALSTRADIALLEVKDASPTKHEYVTIATKNPHVGDDLAIVGHPGQLLYTYLAGFVSGYRIAPNVREVTTHLMQVSSFTFLGSSGGGAFNKQSELVGLTSFLVKTPGQSFYTSREMIDAFLRENGWQPQRSDKESSKGYAKPLFKYR